MAVSKVQYDGHTLIDLTNDTAIASDVALGKTFHLSNGTIATGTAVSGGTFTSGTFSFSGTNYGKITITHNLGSTPSKIVITKTTSGNYSIAYVILNARWTSSSQLVCYSTGMSNMSGTYEQVGSTTTGVFDVGNTTFSVGNTSGTTTGSISAFVLDPFGSYEWYAFV